MEDSGRIHMFLQLAFGLLLAYIVSCGVEGLIYTKLAGNALQLPELVFLLFAVPAVLYVMLTKGRGLPFVRLDWFVLAYLTAVFLSWLTTQQTNALGELLAAIYFTSFYFLGSVILLRYSRQKNLAVLERAVLVSGVAAAIMAMVGWPLLYFMDDDRMAWWFPNYPILGDTIRAKGLFRGPIMLADFLGTILLYFMIRYKLRPGKASRFVLLAIAAISVGLILTKTKSILILYFVLCWAAVRLGVFTGLSKWIKVSIKASGWAALTLYLVTSHLFILNKTDADYQAKLTSPYSSCMEFDLPMEDWVLVPSVYSSQKILAVVAGVRHMPFGIGGNQLIKYNKVAYDEGLLACQNHLTPHSTYFGVFGELGLFGFVILLLLLHAVYRTIVDLQVPASTLVLAQSLFMYVCLQAITADIMNLRHYWLLLVVLAVQARSAALTDRSSMVSDPH